MLKRCSFFFPFFLLAACGNPEPEAILISSPRPLVPGTVSLEINPRVDGISAYVAYYHSSVPAGDPGYQYVTGITKAAPATLTLPGTAVCTRGITNAKALDGVNLPSGVVPQGVEIKFIMPNGWSAGVPGQNPSDNEVALLKVNGTALSPLPYLTYTDNTNKNLYLNHWLMGCTP